MGFLTYITLMVGLTFPLEVFTLEAIPTEAVFTKNRHFLLVR